MWRGKTKDLIAQKQAALQKYQNDSDNALNLVTSTINRLSTINEKIDETIGEIRDAKQALDMTEKDLNITRRHNQKIVEKFKAFIEVDEEG